MEGGNPQSAKSGSSLTSLELANPLPTRRLRRSQRWRANGKYVPVGGGSTTRLLAEGKVKQNFADGED